MNAPLLVSPRLEVPKFEPEYFLTIDFETFYDADYTLKKLATSDYVRDARFETIGVGVNDGEDTVWMEGEEFREWAQSVPWERTAVTLHHAHFDGFILSHHYDVHPAFFFCTMSMARTFGIDGGVSLESLAEHFNVGHKGDEVLQAKGKRRKDFTPGEWLRYGRYCMNDVMLTKAICDEMIVQGFPEAELCLVDSTVKMFTGPEFLLDEPLLKQYQAEELVRKQELLDRIGMDKSAIGSNAKLAAAFLEMGIIAPQKISPAWVKRKTTDEKGKWIYAFAKKDPGMQDLLEHERDEVRQLAEARISVKSTIEPTRIQRFLTLGANGARLPLYLGYWKAHTGRWCMKPESEVLTPDGWVRMDQYRGQSMMQWDPSGALSWCVAAMSSFDFSGELVRVGNEYMRGAFTPEHVIPSWTTKGNFKPRSARDAFGLNISVPTTGILESPGLEISDVMLQLFVAVQADAHIEDPAKRPIRFGFRKARKMERLRALLTLADLPWTEFGGFGAKPERVFSIARAVVPDFLWGAKQFSWQLLKMDLRQREVFLSELWFWDGSVGSKNLHYTTTNKQNAEVVAALARVSGFSANICFQDRRSKNEEWSDKYEVTVHPQRMTSVKSDQWATEHYNGKVFCPTTSTGYFLVRSEGRVFVTGNSGGDKRNPQNLGRVDPRKPRSGMLKKSLVVEEGKEVVAADSGAIEARITAWLAGHEALLDGFREGQDIYSALASEVYGRLVDRKRKPDHPEFNPEDESAGGLGKVAILGLGFQMGWPKFATTLLAGPMGAAPIRLTMKDVEGMNVDLDKFVNTEWKMKRLKKIVSRYSGEDLLLHCAAADKIVTTYRTTNKPIVELWKTMEQVIETMCSAECEAGEQFTFGPNDCLTIVRHGIVLPNGLMLRYPGLRQSEDTVNEDGETVKGGYSYLGQYGKQRQHIYGGSLTENLAQALARLVVAEQMLSIKAKYNYDTKLCTHDEIVIIVDQREAELATWRLVEEMKIPPRWAKGLPLTAEGGHAKCLGEC